MSRDRNNRRSWGGVVVGLATVLAVSGCGGAPAPSHSSSGLSHVHGMAVNPADGQLYVATHHGVVRISEKEASPVGETRHDMMGFAVVGPDHFLASGHPAPDEGGPAHLGLIESTDAGRTWRSRSLSGEADFHLLRAAGPVTYGWNSTSGELMASSDRSTWQVRGRMSAFDLAVDPARADTVLASTESGLRRSTDGGRTWSPVGGPAILLLHWDRGGLHAVGTDARILRSTDGGLTWSPVGGPAPDAPAAFTVHGEQFFVATRNGEVRRSSDAGATWQPLDTSLS